MRTSESLKNIYTAIIKMRTEIAPVTKTKRANAIKYTYNYAPLDNVIELLNVVLPKYGLGWVQTIGMQEGRPALTTRIIHESGEWIEETLILPNVRPENGRNENQELGACITYFKRYALSAMFGIATDEDTDGVADVRERKQLVKAQARAAREEQKNEETGREEAELISVRNTGNEAIDQEISQLILRRYKGRALFSEKTIQWLNNIIETKSPEEALAQANKAATKSMGRIDSETAA